MSATLIENLEKDDIDPLAYHFRRIAEKEFRAEQNAPDNPHPPKKRRLQKNYLLSARREKEARFNGECDVDEIVITAIEEVWNRPPNEDPAARWILEDDIDELWVEHPRDGATG
ncbi:MAG: hypothetical protein Q9227_009384 [Pyrenula ochraceoflavens]